MGLEGWWLCRCLYHVPDIYLRIYFDKISFYRLDWPQTCRLPASATGVLGWQVCTAVLHALWTLRKVHVHSRTLLSIKSSQKAWQPGWCLWTWWSLCGQLGGSLCMWWRIYLLHSHLKAVVSTVFWGILGFAGQRTKEFCKKNQTWIFLHAK